MVKVRKIRKECTGVNKHALSAIEKKAKAKQKSRKKTLRIKLKVPLLE
jgi:hypothetical protein